MRTLVAGLAAGAVGTTLLNTATYLDMALRGRPASSVPDDSVDRLAARLGVSLGDDEATASARRTAIGALLGHATGAAIGAAYGVARSVAPGVPRGVAAVLLGLGAMAATDTGSVLAGVTDPRDWSAADWAADIVPHLVFGWGAAATFDALAGR